jgi:MFS family permease
MDITRTRALAAATLGNMIGSTGAVSAVFGLFLIPLSTTFGWPRASISVVFGIIALVSAAMIPLIGRLADRYGPRRLLIAGNAMLGCGVGLLALSNGDIRLFYLTFVLIAVAGATVSSPILAKVVSDAFDRGRGAALGFSGGVGNGLGGTVVPIAAAVAMAHLGWRGAYVVVALIVVGLGVPCYVFLLRDRPQAAAHAAARGPGGMTLRQAARTRTFWLLIVAVASGGGCLTAVFSHIVPLLAEKHIGVGPATAVVGVFAMAAAGWQVAMGAALDRMSSPRAVAPLYLVAVLGIALLELGHTPGAMLVAGVVLGIGLGTQYAALAYFMGRYFGTRHFGLLIGVAYSVAFMLQGITPILLDHSFDLHRTYAGGLTAIGVCLTIGAGLVSTLPPYRVQPGREEEAVAVLPEAQGGAATGVL